MPREQTEVRDLQEGNYVVIDDVPSQITAYSTSKPGKHGSAKARVEGKGVFDGQKRNFTQPVDAKVWVKFRFWASKTPLPSTRALALPCLPGLDVL